MRNWMHDYRVLLLYIAIIVTLSLVMEVVFIIHSLRGEATP